MNTPDSLTTKQLLDLIRLNRLEIVDIREESIIFATKDKRTKVLEIFTKNDRTISLHTKS